MYKVVSDVKQWGGAVMSRRFRIREGSLADYARIVALGVGFWGLFFWAVVTSYPV